MRLVENIMELRLLNVSVDYRVDIASQDQQPIEVLYAEIVDQARRIIAEKPWEATGSSLGDREQIGFVAWKSRGNEES
jgi:hypothetical protein